MSGKSKKLNRRFDRDMMKRAKEVAEKYEIILSYEDGEWYGKGLEMPLVFGEGASPNACIKNTREALVAAVAHLMETGDAPPVPARQGIRSEQVNIRVSAEEKIILEAAAKQRGFRGLSDFIRAGAIAFTH